jgi:hypothetical protein
MLPFILVMGILGASCTQRETVFNKCPMPEAVVDTPGGTQFGFVTINYRLIDDNGSQACIYVEYSTDNGSTYSPATLYGGDSTDYLATTNSPGYSHFIIWDCFSDNIGNQTCRIRITPTNMSTYQLGTPGVTGDFAVDTSNSFCIRDYLDFTDGNYWAFRRSSDGGIGTNWANASTTLSSYMVNPVTIIDAIYGPMFIQHWSVEGGDLRYIAYQDAVNISSFHFFDPPPRYALEVMTVGATWSDSGHVNHAGGTSPVYSADWLCLGRDNAQFDNGDIIPHCIVVETWYQEAMGSVQRWKIYYAPGAGMVMFDTLNLDGTLKHQNRLIETNAFDN